MFAKPNEQNDYLAEHVALLRQSLLHYAGRDLIAEELTGARAAKAVFFAPFAVLSHDNTEDPIFTYANRVALDLFEMGWEEFIALPSRESAEPQNRQERRRFLKAVSHKGYIDDYLGIRISKGGRRFRIERATVWNLVDGKGDYRGQAAIFGDWHYL